MYPMNPKNTHAQKVSAYHSPKSIMHLQTVARLKSAGAD